MLKKIRKNKKGFTLAELLIVVAIIGVLVAISIPVFTAQLDKSKAATDLANIRAGYADAMSDVLLEEPDAGTTYTLKTDGTVSSSAAAYVCKGDSKNCADGSSVGGMEVTASSWTKGQGITYTWDGTELTFAGA